VALGVGVVGYVLSQPRKGSLEWHKREYLRAWKRVTGSTLRDRIQYVYFSSTKKPEKVWGQPKDLEKFFTNQAVLVQLGYLEARQFTVTNLPARDLTERFFGEFAENQLDFVDVEYSKRPESNDMIVIAPRTFMPTVEEWIRKMDAPQSRK
jgi:hypothetical protein